MWTAKGYSGHGCGELIDSLRGSPAVIAGNARGVFEEVSAAQSKLGGCAVYAVNDVSVFLPRVDHVVSLHAPRLDFWVGLRRDENGSGYGNKDFRVHDNGMYGPRPWHQWTALAPIMALSGLFAAQIAFLMGCRPIVLCGCPTDDTPRFWETDSRPAYGRVKDMVVGEVGRNDEFRRSLKSMSGWTKEFLGGL